MGFADDLNLIACFRASHERRDRKAHEAVFALITSYCNDNGLPVAPLKTEHMERGPLPPQPVKLPSQMIFDIPSHNIQPTDHIKCLGHQHVANPGKSPPSTVPLKAQS